MKQFYVLTLALLLAGSGIIHGASAMTDEEMATAREELYKEEAEAIFKKIERYNSDFKDEKFVEKYIRSKKTSLATPKNEKAKDQQMQAESYLEAITLASTNGLKTINEKAIMDTAQGLLAKKRSEHAAYKKAEEEKQQAAAVLDEQKALPGMTEKIKAINDLAKNIKGYTNEQGVFIKKLPTKEEIATAANGLTATQLPFLDQLFDALKDELKRLKGSGKKGAGAEIQSILDKLHAAKNSIGKASTSTSNTVVAVDSLTGKRQLTEEEKRAKWLALSPEERAAREAKAHARQLAKK